MIDSVTCVHMQCIHIINALMTYICVILQVRAFDCNYYYFNCRLFFVLFMFMEEKKHILMYYISFNKIANFNVHNVIINNFFLCAVDVPNTRRCYYMHNFNDLLNLLCLIMKFMDPVKKWNVFF